MANVIYHPEAQREYQAAIKWYQDRSQRAARRFVAEVVRVVGAIAVQPDRFAWYDDVFREVGLHRYPFSIIYRVDTAGDVLGIAVAHASREPGYWQGRV